MPLPSRLYAILDAEAAARHGRALPDVARAFLDGGARFLQVRAKHADGRRLLEWCDAVVELARPYGADVIVNDRADVARLSGASGVHVGQEDLGVDAVRAVVGPGAMVGVSTHRLEQVDAAVTQPVTYIAIGPVFETASKETGYAAVGLELVRRTVERSRGLPVVAIGGITVERAPSVIAAGAAAVAVISDLLVGSDPRLRVRTYLDALG